MNSGFSLSYHFTACVNGSTENGRSPGLRVQRQWTPGLLPSACVTLRNSLHFIGAQFPHYIVTGCANIPSDANML